MGQRVILVARCTVLQLGIIMSCALSYYVQAWPLLCLGMSLVISGRGDLAAASVAGRRCRDE